MNAASDGGDDELDEDDDDFDGVTNTRLGENMSAVAVPGRALEAPQGVMQPALPDSQCDVILNFGIIDILQEYNMSKQVEHMWKVCLRAIPCHALLPRPHAANPCCVRQTVFQGQHNISAVNPVEYSRRLQDFMHKVLI